jgi:hypothetical protein
MATPQAGGVFINGNLTIYGMEEWYIFWRPHLFPEPLWYCLEIVAIAAGIALAFVVGVISRRVVRNILKGTPQGLVATFTLLSGIMLVLVGLFVKRDLDDRYLWPVVFGSALVLVANFFDLPAAARSTGQRFPARIAWPWALRAASIGLAGILFLVAAAVTLNRDVYDGAQWRAGQLAVRAGIPASEIDAGFGWVGSHTSERAVAGRIVPGSPHVRDTVRRDVPRFS